ncbi:MAG: hypothetical protein PVJ53_08730 [Desulfobacterales bacterium]
MPFELLYGYGHCFGKTTYRQGRVAFEDEARQWMEKGRGADRCPVPPGGDPVWTCPVTGCPGHVQRPWFDYRQVSGGEETPS